jgi:hypothetical protein
MFGWRPETQGCVTAADSGAHEARRADRQLQPGPPDRRRRTRGSAARRPARHGGVDVFEHEPMLDRFTPLLQMDNVICTPHLGYVERQQYEGMYGDQIDRFFSYLQGNPEFIVNPEVLQASARR